MLEVRCVVEYNEEGYLMYADNFPGAYTRGKTKKEALGKMENEIKSYLLWSEGKTMEDGIAAVTVQEKKSELQIADADSEVIFESEKKPLSESEYERLKFLVLKSAKDFQQLYESVPDKNVTNLSRRKTFYGDIPRTTDEMLIHTNRVTAYYLSQVGLSMENTSDIDENRRKALGRIEKLPDFLGNPVFEGSHDEQWSLRKVLRRFIWHDRIHGKAMYRMAISIWGKDKIENPLHF